MPSCRHVAPPRATFLQVGEGEATRTLSSFRCHPEAPFCAITARASASTILFSIFILFEKKMRIKKLVEYHEQCRPWARLPPSENECFVRSVHRDVFSCYIRLVISIRGLNRRGMSPNQPTSLFAFQLRKCFATITFIKIQTRHHLDKLISTKKQLSFFSNE